MQQQLLQLAPVVRVNDVIKEYGLTEQYQALKVNVIHFPAVAVMAISTAVLSPVMVESIFTVLN